MSVSRRQFLHTSAGAAAAASLALTAQQRAIARSANETIVVGVMGVNGRGTALAKEFASTPGARIAYICDVDERAIEKCLKSISNLQAEAPKGVSDFRKILDDKSIDALVCAAPNHWHGPATILGCTAGKHVYVEKPCSHNPREGELMIEAARKYNRVVTMGNQRRSYSGIQEAMNELSRGIIGDVHYSRSWYASLRGSIGTGKEVPVPSYLNYDLWQGPAPERPFVDNLIHYNWHWRWHWGNGELGNNGVHSIDLSRWGLGVDFPIEVSSTGGRFYFQDDQETPDTQVVTFKFPDGKMIIWDGQSCNRHGCDRTNFGASFHGSEGSLYLTANGYEVYDRANKLVRESKGTGGETHVQNFLNCIRSGERPNSDIEEAHKSTLLCHLGNIAYRKGRTLKCNPENGHIVGDEDAMQLWSREYRKGWEPKV